jgi:hypothetical protein
MYTWIIFTSLLWMLFVTNVLCKILLVTTTILHNVTMCFSDLLTHVKKKKKDTVEWIDCVDFYSVINVYIC